VRIVRFIKRAIVILYPAADRARTPRAGREVQIDAKP